MTIEDFIDQLYEMGWTARNDAQHTKIRQFLEGYEIRKRNQLDVLIEMQQQQLADGLACHAKMIEALETIASAIKELHHDD